MKKKYYIFGILYLVAIVFIMNDTWLYTTPIAKLTKVETTREVEGKSTRGTAEKKYSQKMQGIILNGEKKGKTVHFSNEYTYTDMLKQKYHKGDKVFVSGSGIKGVKRDTELVMLLGILIWLSDMYRNWITQRWNIWEALIIRMICSMRKYCYPDWVPLWMLPSL